MSLKLGSGFFRGDEGSSYSWEYFLSSSDFFYSTFEPGALSEALSRRGSPATFSDSSGSGSYLKFMCYLVGSSFFECSFEGSGTSIAFSEWLSFFLVFYSVSSHSLNSGSYGFSFTTNGSVASGLYGI